MCGRDGSESNYKVAIREGRLFFFLAVCQTSLSLKGLEPTNECSKHTHKHNNMEDLERFGGHDAAMELKLWLPGICGDPFQ